MGEGLGPKAYKWAKKAGLVVPKTRNCFNSYFYPVEDRTMSFIDRLFIADGPIASNLDGGSAFHINLLEFPSKENCKKLFETVAAAGCPFFCINVHGSSCCDCDFIDPRTFATCPDCGSRNMKYYTRVIGYVRFIDNFSKERQIEAKRRNLMGVKFNR